MKRKRRKIRGISSIIVLIAFLLSLIQFPQSVKAVSKVTLASPASVKAISASYSSIKLSWKSVKGANGYSIYQATSSSGKYKLIKTVSQYSVVATGLATGETYYYKVRAYKISGKKKIYGTYSLVVSGIPTLAIPSTIKASASTYNSIAVSWGNVQGASGYEIYRSGTSGGEYVLIGATALTNFVDKSIITGSSYYYKVRAYKTSGSVKVYSEYSSIANTKTLLNIPASAKASTASFDSVKVSWGKVPGATGYLIYQATSSTGTYKYINTTKTTSLLDTGLNTGQNYYYKVRAYIILDGNEVYSDYSSVVSAKPTLSVPDSLVVISSSYSSANINWNKVPGATGYQLYRATSKSGSYGLITTTVSDNYVNTGLTAGKIYYYKLRAYRTVGSSKVYSDFSTIENSQLMLKAPASLKASATSYDTIKLTWSSVTGATGYQLYRASTSSGSYSLITTVSSTSYSNNKLTVGNSYYYKVRAYGVFEGSKSYSEFSSISSAKLILAVPKSLKASVYSYDSINITWGSVAGASGYEIYRSEASSGEYKLVTSLASKTYKDSGLKIGTNYYYKVRAYKTVGSTKVYGGYSSIVNSSPRLYTPQNIKAEAASITSVSISWDALGGNVQYELYRAEAADGPYDLISTSAAPSCIDNSAVTDKTYYYKVRAFATVDGSNIYSDFTSVVSCAATLVNVSTVNLNKNTDFLAIGGTDTLTANIFPDNAANKAVFWNSSDTTVVIVDDNGKLTAMGAGTAVVTVTTIDGNKTATCIVTVSDGQDTAEIKGIDVSKWQGKINWASVNSSGVKFAMLRASYGSSGVDSTFATNYAGAKANGIAVGAYHYSYATTTAKAAAEVNFFIKQLQGKQFEYPVCIDMEDPSLNGLSAKTLTDIVLVYLDKLEAAGYYPMIYANKTWFTLKLDDSRLSDYDHWLAQYNSTITYGGHVEIWQYSSKGAVKGISGNVDMDISYVDYETRIKSLHLNGF